MVVEECDRRERHAGDGDGESGARVGCRRTDQFAEIRIPERAVVVAPPTVRGAATNEAACPAPPTASSVNVSPPSTATGVLCGVSNAHGPMPR